MSGPSISKGIEEAENQNKDLKKRCLALCQKKSTLEKEKSSLDYKIESGYRKIRKLRKITFNKNVTKSLISKVFTDSQIDLLMKRPKVYWTDIDLAKAFTLRQLAGRSCYIYLKDTLNIPLPALSAVQKWAASHH